MSRDYLSESSQIYTPELQQRVAEELGQLAAARDNELGLLVKGYELHSHSGTTNQSFLDTIKEIMGIQNERAAQPQQQAAVNPTHSGRNSYVRG